MGKNKERNRQVWIHGFSDEEWEDFKLHAQARGHHVSRLLGGVLKVLHKQWQDTGRYPKGSEIELTIKIEG
jgi:hypothetical protein